MNNRILLRSQKNEILSLIKEAGLDPTCFSWSEIKSTHDPDNIISKLIHINSDFFYSFEIRGESHVALFSPAKDSYIGTHYPGTWESQKICFSVWLGYLVREKTTPDLWKSVHERVHISYRRNMTGHKRYITTEPSLETPEPEQMETKLDKLLEKNRTSERYGSKNPAFLFKRYYGKA